MKNLKKIDADLKENYFPDSSSKKLTSPLRGDLDMDDVLEKNVEKLNFTSDYITQNQIYNDNGKYKNEISGCSTLNEIDNKLVQAISNLDNSRDNNKITQIKEGINQLKSKQISPKNREIHDSLLIAQNTFDNFDMKNQIKESFRDSCHFNLYEKILKRGKTIRSKGRKSCNNKIIYSEKSHNQECHTSLERYSVNAGESIRKKLCKPIPLEVDKDDSKIKTNQRLM